MSKETACKWIDDHRDELSKVSDDVWGFAEYGLLEEKSSRLIASTLERHGLRASSEAQGKGLDSLPR
jgi:metal-dependent amidase/aminoacylase/carboxypeptidase family protein